ncbi:hypothetical protein DLE54_02635 [Psychrobacter sp. YP14]|uniref:hypothetical protein n=1 Tax=Psychrobacter sp. YP14 TaxID=2203895 RepID=UPI000D7E8B2C|nr:hypothetical protein [Psychrobacter sp. YP14]AWT48539.1 hypothetical protein DLE54_02635 [Psychrobacter sp. YP14]
MNIAYTQKMALRLAILATTGFIGQAALAACPAIYSPNDAELSKVNSATSNPEAIYFCKQSFDSNALSFSPRSTELVTAGSQVISRGSTIQQSSISNSSINLSGFTVNSLNTNQLTARYPNRDGAFGSPSLFNFYTRIPVASQCEGSLLVGNQYTAILNYLRSNPSIFRANNGTQVGVTDTSSTNSIAIINNVILRDNDNNPLTASIRLFQSTPAEESQRFTSSTNKMCWVGVGTEVIIKPDGNIKRSGEYKLNIGVLTQ